MNISTLTRRHALKLAMAASALPMLPRQGSTANEVIVGAPNSLTGGFGEAGQRVVMGLEIAANEINRAGGIKALGNSTLRVISADTSSDNPAQAASVARRLITQDGALVLVGSHTSTMTLSSQIEAERAEVPIITTSYADQIVQRGYRYTFKVSPQSSTFSEVGMTYAFEMFEKYRGKRPETIAVFYGSDAASQTTGSVALELAAENGLNIVASGQFPSNLTDPTPIVAPLLQAKPDLLNLQGYTSEIILITRALRSVGLDMPIISSGGGVSAQTIGEALGEAGNGLMGLVAWNWDLPVDGVEQFMELFQNAYPSHPYPPTFEALGQGYAIGWLIKEALEQTGEADSRKLRDTLAQIDVKAILPGERIQFDESGQNTAIEPVMVGWSDGILRSVWPEQYQTTPPIL